MNLDSSTLWSHEAQVEFWNTWDTRNLGAKLGSEALRRGATALDLLDRCGLHRPRILEIGCGNGWLAEKLAQRGPVTGIDIADEAIEEARRRIPSGTFYAGDALDMDLPAGSFDAILTLETFSHVRSQPAFVDMMARLLSPQGYLVITTQNRSIYTRRSDVRPPAPGQIRHWVTLPELRQLLLPRFEVLSAFTIEPSGDKGLLRLINSAKLNRLASTLMSRPKLEQMKERMGLGQTIAALARKR